MAIHPTALVDEAASIGSNPSIGPYSIIGADVTIGDNCDIKSHVVIEGHTTIGDNVQVFPFAVIGVIPQDLKFAGETVFLTIGNDVVIREHATLHPGTGSGGSHTIVGDRCLVMVGAHIAHDCKLGNDIIMVNNAALGGHVEIDDFAILGAKCGVRQFVRIGKHAMIGGMAAVEKDVLPFSTVSGERSGLKGLNVVGLKRREFSRDQIANLRNALALLQSREGLLNDHLKSLQAEKQEDGELDDLIAFIQNTGNRGLTL